MQVISFLLILLIYGAQQTCDVPPMITSLPPFHFPLSVCPLLLPLPEQVVHYKVQMDFEYLQGGIWIIHGLHEPTLPGNFPEEAMDKSAAC